jgi:hypothetical protein
MSASRLLYADRLVFSNTKQKCINVYHFLRNPTFLELERQIECDQFSSTHWFFEEKTRKLLKFKVEMQEGKEGCWLVREAIKGNEKPIEQETKGEFKKEWVSSLWVVFLLIFEGAWIAISELRKPISQCQSVSISRRSRVIKSGFHPISMRRIRI